MEQPSLQGPMIRSEQSYFVEDQAKLQFAHDIERGVPLFRLEGVNGDKDTMPMKVSRPCFQAEVISTPQ
jgi:hypothetical protein